MVHSGYEASAVDDTFGSLRGLFDCVRGMLFRTHPNKAALAALDDPPETTNNPRIPLTISARLPRPPSDPTPEPAKLA
jgi:hypothetical protein